MAVIGYTLTTTDPRDLTEQLARLHALGATDTTIHWDHPGHHTGLDTTLASTRPGDTLATPALDRLASSPEALHDITPTLIDHELLLDIGGTHLNPANTHGRSVFDTYLTAIGMHDA
ncbi:hypothetical protein ACIQ9P_39195 [Kitasatospora sp. NPDC094019]|uniref:hypothetical protein n=1 Tax=Kitasatospora sp. NPDC094019 TaxID=3364091 RepID=UPI00381B54DF